jgi:hypothetical protein
MEIILSRLICLIFAGEILEKSLMDNYIDGALKERKG